MLLLFIFPALVLFALLAYLKPASAVLILAAILPSYLVRFSVFGIPANFLEVSVAVVFAACFLKTETRSDWRKAWRQLPPWITLAIAIFLISSLVSTFISSNPRTSLGILKGWIISPLLMGWLIYAFSFINPVPDYSARVIKSLTLSGLLVALLGLLQIGRLDRVRSIYDVSNSLALYLTPLLAIAFYFVIAGHQKKLYLLSIIIMGAALIFTQSISGIAAVLISMLVGLCLKTYSRSRRARSRTLAGGMVLILLFLAASLSFTFFTGRLNYLLLPLRSPAEHNSLSVRLQLWDISLEILKQHPLLGIGLGQFEPLYQQSLHARFSRHADCQLVSRGCDKPLPEFVFRDPHNWLLSFWLNTGLAGLVSFVYLNGFLLYKNTLGLHSDLFNDNNTVPTAVSLALVSLLLFGLADTIYWKNDLSTLHWLLLGLLIAAVFNRESDLEKNIN